MSQSHGTASALPQAHYFVPGPSPYPVMLSVSMLFVALGGGLWINRIHQASWLLLIGLVGLLATLYVWFGKAIDESEQGHYGDQVDRSFRWSMSWFIFSEVMFFAGFFGALYFARDFSLPMLANLDHNVLWPDFANTWPTAGPGGVVEPFTKMGPWPIPTINTALLLTSGATLTVAHHAMRAGHRQSVVRWMVATLLLGAIFLGLQAYEYWHAYHELGLKLSSGIYGSTFFMLTGFHGFHVTIGAIMLACVLVRVQRGHFTPTRHFAFEGAAWYWHFVDVVWLGLYVVVYWL